MDKTFEAGNVHIFKVHQLSKTFLIRRISLGSTNPVGNEACWVGIFQSPDYTYEVYYFLFLIVSVLVIFTENKQYNPSAPCI